MAWKQKWVIGSGVGGDMFSVNDLYIPRTPAKEKAQLHQVLYESQRTGRTRIYDAGPSKVMEDAAKMHSCLHRYVLEKEARLRQESARPTTARERSRSPRQRDPDADMAWKQEWLSSSGVGGNLYIPRTPAEEMAQLHQALYEFQRTTRKRVDDAGPSRVMQDAGPSRVVQDAAEEYSRSLHCLAEKEAELQQALHKLAITVKEEVLGSFGPSRAVEDAAEAVYAMIESKHSVQGKQNIVDPSTLQLSTQVHGGTQNTDYPYTFQLSPQRGFAPVRPTTSQAPGLP
jgi:hypothetical protein